MTELARVPNPFGLSILERLRPEQHERLAEELAKFMRALKSDDSRKAYRLDWDRWEAFRGAVIREPPEKIRPLHAQAYCAHLEGRSKLAPISQRRAVAVVRSMYGVLVRAGLLDHNPFREVRIGSSEPAFVKVITAAELGDLLAVDVPGWEGQRARAVLWVAAATGVRRKSIASLRVAAIGRGEPPVLQVTAKGGKTAALRIDSRLRDVLLGWVRYAKLKPGDALFPPDQASSSITMHRATVRRDVARVTRAAGLKPHLVPPHAIRRTFATVAYLEGVPLDQIQAALMHADPAITLRYIRVAIPAVQRVGTTVLDAAMKASRERKR